jgi:lipopolysaccharide export system protein LptC
MSLSNTSTFDETGSHRIAIGESRDNAGAFRRAARHSRRVRFLRKAVPAAIAVIVGVTVLVAWFDPLGVLVRLPIDPGRVVISGSKITMQAPKLSGYTRDRRWYELTASAAAQDITKPDLIELHQIRAKIEAQDKSVMVLSAADGTFDRKSNVLTLTRDIVLKSSSGYEMHLEEAVMDTASGEVASDKPVQITSEQGNLKADRLEVSKSGEIVRFIGNVNMYLAAKDDAPPAKEAK